MLSSNYFYLILFLHSVKWFQENNNDNSSLSSKCADSTDSFDFLSSSIRPFLLTTSSIRTKLMNVRFCWLANTGVSRCSSP